MNPIDVYLSRVPDEMRPALEALRETIVSVAPHATETISYQMPTFKYHGRTLAHFAAFKKHCSLFPASGAVYEKFKKELERFHTSKGTLQFTPDDQIPKALVRKIVQARMREIDGT